MSATKAKAVRKNTGTGTLRLKEELQEMEEKFHGKDDLFGPMLLTNGGYISSSRGIMFTSHLRQFTNLENPDFPEVFTNYENIVGKNSTGFVKAKRNSVVIDKIPKFQNGTNDGHIYFLFTYDKENDRYDIIEKRIVEDLTEKFGFKYDNSVMDQKEIGDEIHKGEVLAKTPSYDKDMNYCYGKNVKFMYMLDPNTLEDAILVSKSLSQSMTSKEVETVRISLNDNDIFCNLYGDNQTYKTFPDINEMVRGKIIAAKRRIHNNQVLYDLKSSNLRRVNFSTDVPYYIEERVVDINIFCNKPLDEVEDNSFNEQLKKYLIMQKTFYERMRDRCRQIIDSGSDYSSDINFYYKKAVEYLDDNYKWRDENHSVFNNMNIEFVIERSIPLSEGQKITGRYGNKGVISRIVPDEEMPHLETGERVDVIFNSLGVVNRLNSQQLFEQSITFVTSRVRERMRTMDSLQEKEDLLLRIIWYFNKTQSEKVKEYLDTLTDVQKEIFFEITVASRIYIHNPPLWEEEAMFDRLRDLYAEFDWIKPYDVYINRFGRRIKMMKKLVVGSMYVIKLKQTSKKGFSARSTGSLSKRGTPEKSDKAKTHQDLYSKTPIRIGDQENINSAIGVPSEIIAKIHLFYRSSISGRRNIGENLLENIDELDSFDYSDEFTNRNVEILQAYLKALGVRIEFIEDRQVVKFYTDEIKSYEYDGTTFISTLDEFEDKKLEIDVRKKYRDEELFVGTPEQFEERVQKDIEEAKHREQYYVVDFNQ